MEPAQQAPAWTTPRLEKMTMAPHVKRAGSKPAPRPAQQNNGFLGALGNTWNNLTKGTQSNLGKVQRAGQQAQNFFVQGTKSNIGKAQRAGQQAQNFFVQGTKSNVRKAQRAGQQAQNFFVQGTKSNVRKAQRAGQQAQNFFVQGTKSNVRKVQRSTEQTRKFFVEGTKSNVRALRRGDVGHVVRGGGQAATFIAKGTVNNARGAKRSAEQTRSFVVQGTKSNLRGVQRSAQQTRSFVVEGTKSNLRGVKRSAEQTRSFVVEGTKSNLRGVKRSAQQTRSFVVEGTKSNLRGVKRSAEQTRSFVVEGTKSNLRGVKRSAEQAGKDIQRTADLGGKALQRKADQVVKGTAYYGDSFLKNTGRVAGEITDGTRRNVEQLGKDIQKGDWGAAGGTVVKTVGELAFVPLYVAQQGSRAINGAAGKNYRGEISQKLENLKEGQSFTIGNGTSVSFNGNKTSKEGFVHRGKDDLPLKLNDDGTPKRDYLDSGQLGIGANTGTQSDITGRKVNGAYEITANFRDQGGITAGLTAKAQDDRWKQAGSEKLSASVSAGLGVGSGSSGRYRFKSLDDAKKGAEILEKFRHDHASISKDEWKFLAKFRESHTQTGFVQGRVGEQLNAQYNLFGGGGNKAAGVKDGFKRVGIQFNANQQAEGRVDTTIVQPTKDKKTGAVVPPKARITLTLDLQGSDAVTGGITPRSAGQGNSNGNFAARGTGRQQGVVTGGQQFLQGQRTLTVERELELNKAQYERVRANGGKLTATMAAQFIAENEASGKNLGRVTYRDTDTLRDLSPHPIRGIEDSYRRTTRGKTFDIDAERAAGNKPLPAVKVEDRDEKIIRRNGGTASGSLGYGVPDILGVSVQTTSVDRTDEVIDLKPKAKPKP
jgi:hypothetical protein